MPQTACESLRKGAFHRAPDCTALDCVQGPQIGLAQHLMFFTRALDHIQGPLYCILGPQKGFKQGLKLHLRPLTGPWTTCKGLGPQSDRTLNSLQGPWTMFEGLSLLIQSSYPAFTSCLCILHALHSLPSYPCFAILAPSCCNFLCPSYPAFVPFMPSLCTPAFALFVAFVPLPLCSLHSSCQTSHW